MPRLRQILLIGLFGSLPGSVALGQIAAADAAQYLIFLGPSRPVLLRLLVHIDGVPFRRAWREHVDRTFDELDADQDGQLTVEQAARLYELVGGDRTGDAERLGQSLFGDLTSGEGNLLDRQALAARLKREVPLFNLRIGAAGSGPALFSLLDTDGDRRLSSTELADAADLLRRRDFNDDELFTDEELLAAPRSRTAGADQPAGNALLAVDETTLPADVAELLLARYDLNHDGRLAISGQQLETKPTRAMSRLDKNGDGHLDDAELAEFAARDADVTIEVALGKASSRRIRGGSTRRRQSDGFRLRRRIDGGYRLDVGDAEIELRRNNRDPARAAAEDIRLSTYDADNNGYLDEEEAASLAPLAGHFAAADQNDDGLLYPAELRDFVTRRAAGSALRLSLELRDRGQDLFSMIDSTRDGRLTPRELNASLDLLKIEDTDGDGQLGASEIPQRVELHLARGTDPSAAAVRNVNRRRRTGELTSTAAEAPRWFQKMDRNSDGDVSRREFLGPLETFARLDADRDGLLDASEAAATDP